MVATEVYAGNGNNIELVQIKLTASDQYEPSIDLREPGPMADLTIGQSYEQIQELGRRSCVPDITQSGREQCRCC